MKPDENTPDYTALGVALSQRLRWDGLGILLVAQAALTDANFHKEAAQLGEMIEKL